MYYSLSIYHALGHKRFQVVRSIWSFSRSSLQDTYHLKSQTEFVAAMHGRLCPLIALLPVVDLPQTCMAVKKKISRIIFHVQKFAHYFCVVLICRQFLYSNSSTMLLTWPLALFHIGPRDLELITRLSQAFLVLLHALWKPLIALFTNMYQNGVKLSDRGVPPPKHLYFNCHLSWLLPRRCSMVSPFKTLRH